MSFKLLNKAYGLYQLSLLRIELNIDFDYGQYNWDNNNDYQNLHLYMNTCIIYKTYQLYMDY